MTTPNKSEELPPIEDLAAQYFGEPTDEESMYAQNAIAQEYGYEASNEGWQALAESVMDYNRATDVLMDLASTDATLLNVKRQLRAVTLELKAALARAEAAEARLADQMREKRTHGKAH